MNITATLKDWRIVDFGTFLAVKGTIFDDDKERFPDGAVVRTSEILSITNSNIGVILFTRNSIYKLENPHRSMQCMPGEQ